MNVKWKTFFTVFFSWFNLLCKSYNSEAEHEENIWDDNEDADN